MADPAEGEGRGGEYGFVGKADVRAFGSEDAGDERAVAGYDYLFDMWAGAVAQVDLFAYDGGFFPFSLEFEAGRTAAVVVGVWAFDVEVLDIGEGVGQAPGDVLVVADDDAGCAGEGGAADLEAGFGAVGRGRAGEMHLVPSAGHGHDEVGIVTENRASGEGFFCGDGPGVAALSELGRGDSEPVFQLFVLVEDEAGGMEEPHRLLASYALHNCGVCVWIVRFQIGGEGGVELGGQPGAGPVHFPS